ncbi:phospholipase A [Photobacterium sagamiensis]|uniref:phospholipase A n=1 Tax=Photobacterium sagamiensis TaxID=2910241 RepID=UPI003D0BDDDD
MLKQLIISLMIIYSANSFALADCWKIDDADERLTCYDNSMNTDQAPSPHHDSTETSTTEAPVEFDIDTASYSGIINFFDEQKLFRLSPHEPSYILPAAYNSKPNEDIWQQIKPGSEIDEMEVKFQISAKIKFWDDLYKDNWDLWFGYTQTAWWQLYNADASAPFRETNYSPEIFASYYSNINILGFTLLETDIGFRHQSNGRAELLSRSWNRIYANFQLEKGNFLLWLQPWYRIPEDADDDDNPDIHKYMGYGNFRLIYKNEGHLYSILLRNNLASDNKGAVELSWAFPLYDTVKIYLQYYNGYGESLIDYDHDVNRISLGILLYDWI